ncbi:MAG: hypothetical protein K5798_08320 [Nitrosopumilus sp.]|nr:hypothetical protein [Nitrosopumilus sp.]
MRSILLGVILAIVVFFLIQTVMSFPYGLIFGFVFAVAISFALFSLFTGDGNPAFTSGIQLDDLDHVDDLDGKNVKIYDKVIDKVN